MTRVGIVEARNLAKRFTVVADECVAQLDAEKYTEGYISGTRKSGHLRRLSMDLTRALAAMRKA